jgi:hypothetical protein
MCNTQTNGDFGLCISSGILETRKRNVSEIGSDPLSGEGEKTPAQLGPLERANLSYWSNDGGQLWGWKQTQFP